MKGFLRIIALALALSLISAVAFAQSSPKIKKFGGLNDTLSITTIARTFEVGQSALGVPQLSNFTGGLMYYEDIGVMLSAFTISAADSLSVTFQAVDYWDSVYNLPFEFTGRIISSGASVGPTTAATTDYIGGEGAMNVWYRFPNIFPIKKLRVTLTGFGAAAVDHRVRLSAFYRSTGGE